MPNLMIRHLDDKLMTRLRKRADRSGRSMEEEAREIIRQTVGEDHPPPHNLAAAIRARIAPLGGVELDIPPREPMPRSPLP